MDYFRLCVYFIWPSQQPGGVSAMDPVVSIYGKELRLREEKALA